MMHIFFFELFECPSYIHIHAYHEFDS